jgi:hypothetical protein
MSYHPRNQTLQHCRRIYPVLEDHECAIAADDDDTLFQHSHCRRSCWLSPAPQHHHSKYQRGSSCFSLRSLRTRGKEHEVIGVQCTLVIVFKSIFLSNLEHSSLKFEGKNLKDCSNYPRSANDLKTYVRPQSV